MFIFNYFKKLYTRVRAIKHKSIHGKGMPYFYHSLCFPEKLKFSYPLYYIITKMGELHIYVLKNTKILSFTTFQSG